MRATLFFSISLLLSATIMIQTTAIGAEQEGQSDTKPTLNVIHFKGSELQLGSEKKCCICYDVFEENDSLASLQCALYQKSADTDLDLELGDKEQVFKGHFFHSKCINPWLESNKSCPLCRIEFKTERPQETEADTEEGIMDIVQDCQEILCTKNFAGAVACITLYTFVVSPFFSWVVSEG